MGGLPGDINATACNAKTPPPNGTTRVLLKYGGAMFVANRADET